MNVRDVRVAFVLVLVAACGRGSGDARKTCEKAAARWEQCVGEILGPEASSFAASREDLGACVRDGKTVAMYRACLQVTDCVSFLDCIEEQVQDTQPPIGAGLPRAEQCEQHVKDGLRAVAFQEARRQSTKDCVLDESRGWESCIGKAELATVRRYGEQRQRECEGWPDEHAACVFHLPGATGCDPDSFPLWRLPLDQGPAGPAVAWTLDVREDDDGIDLAWADEHTLIVRDADAVRAIRDGKERWRQPPGDRGEAMVIAGGWLAMAADDQGVALVEIETGATATALADESIDTFGPVGDRVLVLGGGGAVFEVAPALCKKGSCASRLGAADERDGLDALAYTDAIAGTRDQLVFTSSQSVLVTDRKLAVRASITFEADDTVLAGDNVIVADGQGIAILALARCEGEVQLESTQDGGGDCVLARNPGGWIQQVAPLPDGSVAWNSDLSEETRRFGPDGGSWSLRTAAVGEVAGDRAHVFAVSLGHDAAGPVRLLAIADGAIAWQTELAAVPPDAAVVRIAARDGVVAAQVGPRVHVVATH